MMQAKMQDNLQNERRTFLCKTSLQADFLKHRKQRENQRNLRHKMQLNIHF